MTWQWWRAETHLAIAREQQTQAQANYEEALRQQQEKEAQAAEARLQGERAARIQRQLSSFVLQSQLQYIADTKPVLSNKLAETMATIREIETTASRSDQPSVEAAGHYLYAANLQRRLGRLGKAAESLATAARIFRKHLNRNPTAADYQQALAATLHWQGVVLQERGESKRALKLHQEAMQLQQHLATQRDGSNYAAIALARSHISIADLYGQEHVEAATAEYVKAYHKLIQLDRITKGSADPQIRHELAVCLRQVAEGGLRLGQLPASQVVCEHALLVGQAAVDEMPHRRDWQAELARTQFVYGQLLRDQDVWLLAESAFEYAAENQREVVGNATHQDAPNAVLRKYLANLGEAHLRTGHTSKAIEVAIERQELPGATGADYFHSACLLAACMRILDDDESQTEQLRPPRFADDRCVETSLRAGI